MLKLPHSYSLHFSWVFLIPPVHTSTQKRFAFALVTEKCLILQYGLFNVVVDVNLYLESSYLTFPWIHLNFSNLSFLFPAALLDLFDPNPSGRDATSWQGLNGTNLINAHYRPQEERKKEGSSETTRENSPEPEPAALSSMAANREQQVRHMTGYPRAMYPFAFNSIRSHSHFDLLASSHLFGRFGADLPKEMAALCE